MIVEHIGGELGWTITYEIHSHHVEFVVYEIACAHWSENGKLVAERGYIRKGGNGPMDNVVSIDDAQSHISGYIKWDGCSEISLGDHHLCGKNDVKKMSDLLLTVYKRCGELMKEAGSPTLEGEFD